MRIIFFLFLNVLTGICFAQTDSTSSSLNNSEMTTSYGLYIQCNGIGYIKPYAELGIGRAVEGPVGHHYMSHGSYLSSEIKIDFNRAVLGPKIGTWVSGGAAPISIGLSAIYYSDVSAFEKGSLRIRPEVGLGMFYFRTFLGVNIPVMNYRLSREYVNLVTLGAMLYLPVVKK